MRRMCRDTVPPWRRQRWSSEVLRHAHLVTDPKKLAHLKAEAEKVRLSRLIAPSPNYR